MKAPTKSRHEKISREQSRRMLAVDSLNAAIAKVSFSVKLALGILLEAGVFDKEETGEAKAIYSGFDDDNIELKELFGRGFDGERTTMLRLAARSLFEEISALREIAFWLLPPSDHIRVELYIRKLLRQYEDVRRLIRMILSKDFDHDMPDDPVRVPGIPANRYLSLTHPELLR